MMAGNPTQKELENRIKTLEKELSDCKKQNSALKINQQYLEAILNNTNLAIFLKDANFKYILMNRQLGLLAHADHEQVRGKQDSDFFPEEIASLFRSQDEEVLRRKSLVEFEETIFLPDGMQSFMTAKFPLIDDEGKVYAVGGVCTDITARKQTEAELKEAEEKYRGIFEHSPLGIMHLDNKGIVTACNETLAGILGTRVEEIKGLDSLQSIQNEKIKNAINSVLSGEIAHYEGSYLPLNEGERVYIRAVSSPIFSSVGDITGAICIVEDITKRREAEKALQVANEKLEQRVAERTAQLDRKNERLVETNVALKILLEKREEDKNELEEKVMFKVEKLVFPYMEKLRLECESPSQESLLQIIQANLDDITSSFACNHKDFLAHLTPAQIQIADLIKQGQSTKQIANLLNLSPATIACQRQEIRKRLSLTHKKVNLQTVLATNGK